MYTECSMLTTVDDELQNRLADLVSRELFIGTDYR